MLDLKAVAKSKLLREVQQAHRGRDEAGGDGNGRHRPVGRSSARPGGLGFAAGPLLGTAKAAAGARGR